MGILKSVFRKDWGKELARAEAHLAEGRAVRALEIARRVERGGDDTVRQSAGLLADRAEKTLIDSALAKAKQAEDEGAFEDAADWLLAAIDRLGGDPRAGELTRRREALLERADDENAPFSHPNGEPSAPPQPTLDLDTHYEALVSMLEEPVAKLYSGRSRRFREAVVALNDAEVDLALETLDELVSESPEDGVLHLERGRAYLLVDEADKAREDFETAWRDLGDGPLDRTDSLSVPSLWAEAAREVGDDEAVVRRLADLAEPDQGRSEIGYHFAAALLATGRHDEARDYLRSAVVDFSGDPRFPLLLAELLADEGEIGVAIECLEASVAPSCAGGSCSRAPKHLPSLLALAELHLVHGEELDRVPELLAHIAHEQAGYLGAREHEILAGYYERTGKHEAAVRSLSEAERPNRVP